jgi:hypothetical protein
MLAAVLKQHDAASCTHHATLEEAQEGLSPLGLATTAHQLHLQLQDTHSALEGRVSEDTHCGSSDPTYFDAVTTWHGELSFTSKVQTPTCPNCSGVATL